MTDDILLISGDCWESWVVVPVKGGGGVGDVHVGQSVVVHCPMSTNCQN